MHWGVSEQWEAAQMATARDYDRLLARLMPFAGDLAAVAKVVTGEQLNAE